MDLINLSLCIPLNGNVAEHVWLGKDVSYKYLKVFGCRAFTNTPNVERSKLDGKKKECIFLGHAHDDFGYKLWSPMKKRVYQRRDVILFKD